MLTKAIWANKKWAGFWQISQYINCSNKRGLHDYQFWKILPSTFNDFITKVSYVIVEPNEDFSHGHFELWNFILARKMMFITLSTFSDFAFFAPFCVYSNLHVY